MFWLGKPAVIRKEQMELMKNEIEQPNTDILISPLQPGEQIKLKEGLFKGQEAMVEHVSNNKVHLFLSSLGIKLVISKRDI